MKGHNYYGICKKCGKEHIPPNKGLKRSRETIKKIKYARQLQKMRC